MSHSSKNHCFSNAALMKKSPPSQKKTLKNKIVWTLIFKIVVVFSLFWIFKAYKKVVYSQDVAQKLLTMRGPEDPKEF